METWKPVVGLEDYYEVSDMGNVRSLVRWGKTNYGHRTYGGANVKPFLANNGYLAVNLTKKGYRKQFHVHSLVLETFVGKRPEGMECCHNDGNRTNAKLKNLRWDTRKNNHKDQLIHGTKAKVGIKLNFKKAQEIRESNLNPKELSKKYDISLCHIWSIKNNKVWKNDN